MNKINSISLSTLVVALSGAPFWGIISSYLFNYSKNSIFISMIIGFIIGLVIVKIFLLYFNKESNKTIVEKNKNVYGKFSIIVNSLFIILSLSIYLFLTYRLTSFLSSQYLIQTPKIYMYLLILITTFYISSKGIETITRVSTISLFLALIIFSFDFFSLIQYINFDNYLPLINTNTLDIIKSSIIFSIYFSVPCIYITTYKKDIIVDKDKFNKTFYLFFILSFIVVFLAAITTLGIFGSKLTSMFEYPLYSILKRIELFSFIDSVENISIILWLLYIINSSSVILNSTINSIEITYNIKNKKIINIILFIILLIIPKLFLMNNNYVESFKYVIVPLTVCVIILIQIIISLFLSKKKM